MMISRRRLFSIFGGAATVTVVPIKVPNAL